jgi:C-terminal processing protease CtpA/Prc
MVRPVINSPSAGEMMKRFRVALVLGSFVLTTGRIESQASIPQNKTGSALRLQRLETLADIWGKLELYHPYVTTHKSLAWDSVLVRAIPKVEAAGSPEEFVAVLNTMVFAPIGDPLSYAKLSGPTSSTDPYLRVSTKLTELLQPRVGYLNATNPAALFGIEHFATTAIDPGEVGKRIHAAINALGPVDVIVVDLRWNVDVSGYDAPWLGLWTDSAFTNGTRINRVQRGHYNPNQWAVRPARTLGRPGALDSLSRIATPTVFLTNLNSYPQLEAALDKLRQRPNVSVALERSGRLPESWELLTYPEGVRVRINAWMILSADGALGSQADTVIGPLASRTDLARLSLALAAKRSTETPRKRAPFAYEWRQLPRYPESTEPLSREWKIFGLIRLWKEIGTFSGYLKYASVDWNNLLRDWIPAVDATTTTRDYYLTLRRIVAKLNDAHASVQHSSVTVPGWTVPAQFRRIEHRVIATRIDTANIKDGSLKVGDELLAVDGIPVDSIEATIRMYRGSSRPSGIHRTAWESAEAVRGEKNSIARLKIADARGTRTVAVARVTNSRDLFLKPEHTPTVDLLPGNIGYINYVELRDEAELDSALIKLKDTDALILDARLGSFAWRGEDIRHVMVSRFFDKPVTVPKGKIAVVQMGDGPPTRMMTDQIVTYYPHATARGAKYLKPIAMLINIKNQSAAEEIIWPFKVGARATFVGSQTSGTNGGAPDFGLPGGGYAVFTHEEVTYPDGSRFHGVGIVPDVPVEQTIKGVRDGRDEVLLKAAQWLRDKSGKARRSSGN